jgi:hypothetical protein
MSYPRVRGVVFASGADRSEAINAVADRHGLPPRLLVALADAESDRREDAARPSDPARYAEYWPDVSFGPYQQTVRWARVGDGSPTPENIALVRERYTQDFDSATDAAARQLVAPWRAHADPVETLCRYNKPATGLPATDPRRARYRAAWERSAAYEAPEPQKEVCPMPDEVAIDLWNAAVPGIAFDRALGIANWWAEGGYRQVGSPVGPERLAADGSPWQAFTRGVVHWTSSGAEIDPQ